MVRLLTVMLWPDALTRSQLTGSEFVVFLIGGVLQGTMAATACDTVATRIQAAMLQLGFFIFWLSLK
jgi:hypothetical protein